MVPEVDAASVAWMNYTLVASNALTIPLVLITKEKYVRSDLDAPSNTFQSNNLFGDDEEDGDTAISSSNVPYHVMQ